MLVRLRRASRVWGMIGLVLLPVIHACSSDLGDSGEQAGAGGQGGDAEPAVGGGGVAGGEMGATAGSGMAAAGRSDAGAAGGGSPPDENAGAGGSAGGGAPSSAGAAGSNDAGQGGSAPSGNDRCLTDAQCAADQHCVGTTSRRACVEPSDYCSIGRDCPGGRGVCQAHRCSAAVAQDGVCQDSWECVAGTSCQQVENDASRRCLPSLAEWSVCDGVDPLGNPVVNQQLACPAETECLMSDQILVTDYYCAKFNARDSRLCMFGCESGHYCFGEVYGSGPEDLFCTEQSGAYGDCSADVVCRSGLSCGLRYETSQGEQYGLEACIESPGVGDSCEQLWYPADPGLGSKRVTCAPDAYCDAGGTCRALPGAGADCVAGMCAPSLRCVDGWADGHCE